MMIWTNKEKELIAILDKFIENCSRAENLKNSSHHRLLEQILAVTKGDVATTKKYCEQILNPQAISQEKKENNLATLKSSGVKQAVTPFEQPQQNYSPSRKIKIKKFKSFWTLLFLLCSIVTIFFIAKKSPYISSSKTFSSIAVICPANLIETARAGITNRDELLLEKAIADFQALKEKQNDLIGIECEQILGEAQFIYAIDFLASQGKQKKAVANLCAISAEYYQNRELIPWFTRWSNTNPDFGEWLTQYKIKNNCSVATYLE